MAMISFKPTYHVLRELERLAAEGQEVRRHVDSLSAQLERVAPGSQEARQHVDHDFATQTRKVAEIVSATCSQQQAKLIKRLANVEDFLQRQHASHKPGEVTAAASFPERQTSHKQEDVIAAICSEQEAMLMKLAHVEARLDGQQANHKEGLVASLCSQQEATLMKRLAHVEAFLEGHKEVFSRVADNSSRLQELECQAAFAPISTLDVALRSYERAPDTLAPAKPSNEEVLEKIERLRGEALEVGARVEEQEVRLASLGSRFDIYSERQQSLASRMECADVDGHVGRLKMLSEDVTRLVKTLSGVERRTEVLESANLRIVSEAVEATRAEADRRALDLASLGKCAEMVPGSEEVKDLKDATDSSEKELQAIVKREASRTAQFLTEELRRELAEGRHESPSLGQLRRQLAELTTCSSFVNCGTRHPSSDGALSNASGAWWGRQETAGPDQFLEHSFREHYGSSPEGTPAQAGPLGDHFRNVLPQVHRFPRRDPSKLIESIGDEARARLRVCSGTSAGSWRDLDNLSDSPRLQRPDADDDDAGYALALSPGLTQTNADSPNQA